MAAPAFLEPLVTAPRWQKVALGLMGLALLAGGSYFLLLSPLEVQVNGLRAREAALQVELVEARRLAADLARARREAAELEARLAVLQQRLPTEKEMPPLFRALTDAAYQAGLLVSLFQPRETRVRDYYVEVPITLQADGGYHQVGQFFERVAGLPRVVNVSELKLAGQAKSQALRADLTLATYVYRPLGSAPAPKPGQPAPAGSPR